ncbi:alpha-ketoglutarate-dependent sulfonate dioxygenase [Acephala macrosclerotiorum]|nr:alpha-ketoglutarate-dependent sulfonate dioxygenase [Acephala macrosclerotiorum]
MAPPSAEVDIASSPELTQKLENATIATPARSFPTPLKYSGSLDEYENFDVTSVIGREFPKLQLSEILEDDVKIRDLAITVSQRGVVFFRKQDLTNKGLKILAQRLGELSGKPKQAGLYRHPLSNYKQNFAIDEEGAQDDEISLISSEQRRGWHKDKYGHTKVLASGGWHSDFTFEHNPTDYGVFKVLEAPEDVGGDTIWASGYEAYDRLSPPFQKAVDGLTATHRNPNFHRQAKNGGFELVRGPRGHPDNVPIDCSPLVRTNPVTGWKSLFTGVNSLRDGWINDVTDRENEILKDYFKQLFVENHDLQVRNRWGKDDIAIWDDRSVVHVATNDYFGKRTAYRVSSVGEKPYFDPNSVSRREALSAF